MFTKKIINDKYTVEYTIEDFVNKLFNEINDIKEINEILKNEINNINETHLNEINNIKKRNKTKK